MRMVDAVTVPLLALGPAAVMQSPTARLEAEADWVWLYVVDEARFTRTVPTVGGVGRVGLVEPDLAGGLAALSDEKPDRVKVDEVTLVTWPLAKPKLAKLPGRRNDPGGPVPGRRLRKN